MSGFWAAAERARSGAPGDASPRPLSRFEAEPGEHDAFEVEETTSGDALPVAAPPRIAPGADTNQSLPANSRQPESTEAPPMVEAAARTAPAADGPPPAQPPPVILASAPASSEMPPPAAAPTTTSVSDRLDGIIEQSPPAPPTPAAALQPVAPPPDLAPAEPEARAVQNEPPAAAAPLVTIEPREVIAQPRLAEPSVAAETVSPAIEAAALEPLRIHIERIEIRIDPQAAPTPAAPARRQAPAPVDLNDYLSRRAG